jgi:hypothetical protein
MGTIARVVRGTATVLLAGTLAVAATGTTAMASEGHGNGKTSSHSANDGCGEYCSTRDGSPSHNGNGHGKSTGRPCAGCVGNADDKNPHGQYANGSDHNNGYECDGNSGIARTNPAHTGCTTPQAPSTTPDEVTSPPAGPVVTPPESPAGPAVEPVVVTPGAPSPTVGKVPVEVGGVTVTKDAKTPEVLGVRLTRPLAAPDGTQGTLPFTGSETVEWLLAGLALLVTGLVVTREGSRRRTA